jgi:hypothetical protein
MNSDLVFGKSIVRVIDGTASTDLAFPKKMCISFHSSGKMIVRSKGDQKIRDLKS